MPDKPTDNIVPFSRPTPKQKNKGKTLCKSGFHKWVTDKSTPFDSKQGQLVTRSRCSRCGKIRVNSKPN
ncbi:MAG: hypothetical protein OQK13_03995 [Gammaproteobacteria bacterium]|nr:hypothetical protein [Gammaproteobacteria bacterium]